MAGSKASFVTILAIDILVGMKIAVNLHHIFIDCNDSVDCELTFTYIVSFFYSVAQHIPRMTAVLVSVHVSIVFKCFFVCIFSAHVEDLTISRQTFSLALQGAIVCLQQNMLIVCPHSNEFISFRWRLLFLLVNSCTFDFSILLYNWNVTITFSFKSHTNYMQMALNINRKVTPKNGCSFGKFWCIVASVGDGHLQRSHSRQSLSKMWSVICTERYFRCAWLQQFKFNQKISYFNFIPFICAPTECLGFLNGNHFNVVIKFTSCSHTSVWSQNSSCGTVQHLNYASQTLQRNLVWFFNISECVQSFLHLEDENSFNETLAANVKCRIFAILYNNASCTSRSTFCICSSGSEKRD